MAFDRHIEADNIEDGFITSIVRAPVVGLAWVLGGLLHDEDKENKDELKPQLEDEQSKQHPGPMNPIHEGSEFTISSKRSKSGLGIGSSSDDSISFASCKSGSSDRLMGDETPNSQTSYLQRKKTRKMSWSDESGQDLVIICGGESNNSPQRTAPGNIPNMTIGQSKHEKNRKPMKSAIRNLRALPQQRQTNKHNCIPSMVGSTVINGAGTVVGAVGKKTTNNTNNHSHPNAKSNGYISPQWGWYISTTPPTPEYHNTAGLPNNKGQVLSHQMNNTSNTLQPQANSAIGRHWNPTTDTILEGAAPRPVFRKANPRPGGWPTVPI